MQSLQTRRKHLLLGGSGLQQAREHLQAGWRGLQTRRRRLRGCCRCCCIAASACGAVAAAAGHDAGVRAAPAVDAAGARMLGGLGQPVQRDARVFARRPQWVQAFSQALALSLWRLWHAGRRWLQLERVSVLRVAESVYERCHAGAGEGGRVGPARRTPAVTHGAASSVYPRPSLASGDFQFRLSSVSSTGGLARPSRPTSSSRILHIAPASR